MRNPDYFYNLTATQTGFNEEVVKKANEFYWKRIKKIVRTGEHPVMFVRSLGTLHAVPNLIKKELLKIIEIIRFFRSNPERSTEKMMSFYLNRFKELWILRHKALDNKIFIRNRKLEMQDE